MSKLFGALFSFFCLLQAGKAFPDQGKWDFTLTPDNPAFTIPKSLFVGAKIYAQIICEAPNPATLVRTSWELAQSLCWGDYRNVFDNADSVNGSDHSHTETQVDQCNHGNPIVLRETVFTETPNAADGHAPQEKSSHNEGMKRAAGDQKLPQKGPIPVFIVPDDGVYIFSLHMSANQNGLTFNASVHVKIIGTYGYLSAADYPLLPFFEIMCVVYVIYGLIWLGVSFMQWRDLLRIQFWIGGVILLGMLEKAMFYAEYHSINTSGESLRGVVLVAEWVSCAKRTLARMLVIIVSLGFGIVKPRLGPMLHRVVGVGGLYFILACVESYLRVMHTKNDAANEMLIASIPLAVLDSAICWWIFTSLVQTTRTLRLRRNTVKLTLYRHFTNTLIFSVMASIIFMLYSIKAHRFSECLTDWKELWVDDAFWHVLFSVLLLVIMILWRPTNNNQRYAFTPLLDNPEDDDDDEEDQFINDGYGVKMRGQRSSSPRLSKSGTTEEDDLRWVEENIPSAIADAALPVIDSDEEIMNTKFEVSKMQ